VLSRTSEHRLDKRVDAVRRNPDLLAAILEHPEGTSVTLASLVVKAHLDRLLSLLSPG
jgi:hypothetical protein